jgi:hypothetical protein
LRWLGGRWSGRNSRVGSVEAPAWLVAVVHAARLRGREGLVSWRVAWVLTKLGVEVMASVGS